MIQTLPSTLLRASRAWRGTAEVNAQWETGPGGSGKPTTASSQANVPGGAGRGAAQYVAKLAEALRELSREDDARLERAERTLTGARLRAEATKATLSELEARLRTLSTPPPGQDGARAPELRPLLNPLRESPARVPDYLIRRPSRGAGPRELVPEDFRPQPAMVLNHASDLAHALTRQILNLLKRGTITPGDVLLDLKGISTRICGSRTVAARWAQAAFRQTAARSGLLRYRPRRPEDPRHATRTHVWEISEAAPALAGVITNDLATAPAHPHPCDEGHGSGTAMS